MVLSVSAIRNVIDHKNNSVNNDTVANFSFSKYICVEDILR